MRVKCFQTKNDCYMLRKRSIDFFTPHKVSFMYYIWTNISKGTNDRQYNDESNPAFNKDSLIACLDWYRIRGAIGKKMGKNVKSIYKIYLNILLVIFHYQVRNDRRCLSGLERRTECGRLGVRILAATDLSRSLR